MGSCVRLLSILLMLLSASLALDLEPALEVQESATAWVSLDGQPVYYTSIKSIYTVDNQLVREMSNYAPNAEITLSPRGDHRLISTLQSMDAVKNSTRYADYVVLDDHHEVQYSIQRGTDSDLKPLVAAVSDGGILALADPVNALIYLYSSGDLIAEGQIYREDGNLSMERNILMQWVGDRCYILLERPGFNGGPAGKSIFISLNAQGQDQITAFLPITYLQDKVFDQGRFFVSGYDYSATSGNYNPLIVELDPTGQVLWTNENWGHELTLSGNGDYLGVLSSHEYIQLFDLSAKRVEKIRFDHQNKVCLGLAVNNVGKVAVIRVAADFFAKRNTHFGQIYFPLDGENVDIQIDPRYPRLFKIQTDGDRFYVGTSFEWLEIHR